MNSNPTVRFVDQTLAGADLREAQFLPRMNTDGGNPDFNSLDFEGIRNEAGRNSFAS
jgi:hypothetical protein